MTRITIGVLICSAFALTLTVQGANSASLNTTSVLKESIIAPDILQNVHLRRCVTNCHWGWYRAGNGKIYTGCHRNDWSCAWRLLATRKLVAGGGADRALSGSLRLKRSSF